jgi:predicted flap endonuclease-1-like 5' DNA nuclease
MSIKIIKNLLLITVLTLSLTYFPALASSNVVTNPSSTPTTPVVAPVSVSPVPATPVIKETSQTPVLNPVKSDEFKISGTAIKQSKLEFKDSSGAMVVCKNAPVVANNEGVFSCELNSSLGKNTEISAYATEDSKNQSLPNKISVIEVPTTPIVPAAIIEAFDPLKIDTGILVFNVPKELQTPDSKSEFKANLDLGLPNIDTWKLAEGVAIPTLGGMVPAILTKDPNNVFSVLLSNQTPEIAKKPTTRLAFDQEALDKASGIKGFKPVELGGESNMVRIPNFSTPETNDWWYIPKSSLEVDGYKVIENDVKNFGTEEATNGFYKGVEGTQIKPVNAEQYPYSFILEGTPKSFELPNALNLNLKANTAENIAEIDALVKGSKFDNSNLKFKLPELKTPKLAGFLPNISLGSVEANKGGWWWIWPILALLFILAMLAWWFRRFFGFGTIEDEILEPDYSVNTIRTGELESNTYTNDLKNTTSFEKIQEEVSPKYVDTKIENTQFTRTADEISGNVSGGYTSSYNTKYDNKVLNLNPEPVFNPTLEVKESYEDNFTKIQENTANIVKTGAALGVASLASKEIINDYKKEEQKTNIIEQTSNKSSFSSTMAYNGKEEDFQIIEGIGPVINKHLHSAGIHTFEQLSQTSEEKLQEILREYGVNFVIYNPKTWAAQADLANQGKFEELEQWKKELFKGL